MPAKNLIGRTFGRLTVTASSGSDKFQKSTWLCKCSCGKEKIIGAGPLLRGDTLSCGCLNRELAAQRRFVNLESRRFGRLLVLAFRGANKTGHSLYQCRCDCGKEKIIKAGALVQGTTKSCGCANREERPHRRGENSPNWKGGITSEQRSIRTSTKYKRWRASIFTRDNFLCQACGNGGDIQAHHIKPFALFPDLRFEISNGQTLCVPCHKKNSELRGEEII